jgi:hypothetical protein
VEIKDNPESKTITINGFRYSYELFHGLLMVTREDRALRITNVDDGVITLQSKVVPPDFWIEPQDKPLP